MSSPGDGQNSADRPPDEATRVESPAAKRKLVPESTDSASFVGRPGHTSMNRSAAASASFSMTTSSPLDVLHIEEVERTRVFAQLSIPLCIFLILALPFFGGDPTVRWTFIGGVVGCMIQAIYASLALRNPANYDIRWVTAFAVWAALTTYVGVILVGIFSVGPTAVVVGIYFFGRTQSPAGAMLIYVIAVVCQGGLALLVLTGGMKDPGIFTAHDVPMRVAIFIQVLVQALFFIAFALSRSTRASSLRAIEDLQRVMNQVAQREALFQEVRQDLDNALMLGGAGRYTEHEVGAYKLGSVIGRGAMAEVYEAVDKNTGERAAVKLLHPNVLDSDGAIERFFREAQAAGALDSPYAVKVLQSSSPEERLPYLAMELLEGHDLAFWLRKRRRLSIREVVELVSQVGPVIDLAAHASIVHRDIKPQNLFRHEPRDGIYQWKILDFGMSTLGENAGTLTGGHVVGTPAYMAPEQARGKPVDSRADLYSLAAVAYRCLTGRAPFSAKDVPSLLYAVVYDTPPQPSSIVDLPPQLDDVLAVALAKKRSNRFASGQELATAFAAAAEGRTDDWLQRRAEALLLDQPWDTRK